MPAPYTGTPLRRDPFPPRGHIGAEEQDALARYMAQVVASGTMPGYDGNEENAYCCEFAAYMGGGYADAVNSGTSGLYAALKALDLEPFGEVIVSAVTDPGGMMPIPLLNLVPMVADSAPGSYNSGPAQVEELVTSRTRAIVLAHIGGEPADAPAVAALARHHGLPLIEDCSQSHGATLAGRLVGTFGDIAIFSTMSGKHHCSGGQGGLVYTRDERLYQAIRRASDRGKPFFLPVGATNVTASLNLNLSDLAAVIGRAQLRKLPAAVARRRAIVADLAAGIADLAAVSLPPQLPGASASYWFLRLRYHPEAMNCDKATYCRALVAEGLPVSVDYRAALPHTQAWFVERRVFGRSGYPWACPDYQGERDRVFPCPNAQAAMDAHFNLALHENWGAAEVADTLAILAKVDAVFHRAA